jgi:hypothetical protein
MVNRKYISFFAIAVLLLGCKKNNPEVTTSINLEPFSEIQINSSFDIQLQEDSIFYVEIKGHQKSVESIHLSLKDEVLRIENTLKNKFLSPKTNKVSLIIHSKPLKLIQADETCFISTINPITSDEFGLIMKSKGNNANLELNAKSFYFWNNYPCGGRLILRGQTDQLKIWSSAIFAVDAKNLIAKYAFVDNNSKGNCIVNVTDALEYAIKSEGNIEAYGSPALVIKKEGSGSGQFILN